jgi:MFS family permease
MKAIDPVGQSQRLGVFSVAVFRWFTLGYLGSSLSTWLLRVVQDVLAYDSTGAASSVGLISAFQFTPALVLTFLGGRIADGGAVRSALLVAPLLTAAAAGGLIVTDVIQGLDFTAVAVSALLLGIGSSFDMPLRQAVVGDIVPIEQMASAVGIGAITQHPVGWLVLFWAGCSSRPVAIERPSCVRWPSPP